ncbi:hypothetical protein OKA04_20240 [Luteolibacter flavescens]|uniref:Lipoprotein n=1 Tax=Luteolibacter flavescens TaxID=1859460 RepID=A0ABT3FU20_9BACT|nr:hypothetical protein [Luteolibacter flavescens]MCW1887079.1 hypothetical protein [Luteolibacter flavescens]
MMKPACCLFLALGLAACAPKAVVVEDPVPPTGQRKPTKPEAAPTTEQPPALVNRDSGMILPDLTKRLPNGRDMAPTTPAPAAGGGVIATPPTADKRGE